MKVGLIVDISPRRISIKRARITNSRWEFKTVTGRKAQKEWKKIKAAGDPLRPRVDEDGVPYWPYDGFPLPRQCGVNDDLLGLGRRVTLDEVREAKLISEHFLKFGGIPDWAQPPKSRKNGSKG